MKTKKFVKFFMVLLTCLAAQIRPSLASLHCDDMGDPTGTKFRKRYTTAKTKTTFLSYDLPKQNNESACYAIADMTREQMLDSIKERIEDDQLLNLNLSRIILKTDEDVLDEIFKDDPSVIKTILKTSSVTLSQMKKYLDYFYDSKRNIECPRHFTETGKVLFIENSASFFSLLDIMAFAFKKQIFVYSLKENQQIYIMHWSRNNIDSPLLLLQEGQDYSLLVHESSSQEVLLQAWTREKKYKKIDEELLKAPVDLVGGLPVNKNKLLRQFIQSDHNITPDDLINFAKSKKCPITRRLAHYLIKNVFENRVYKPFLTADQERILDNISHQMSKKTRQSFKDEAKEQGVSLTIAESVAYLRFMDKSANRTAVGNTPSSRLTGKRVRGPERKELPPAKRRKT